MPPSGPASPRGRRSPRARRSWPLPEASSRHRWEHSKSRNWCPSSEPSGQILQIEAKGATSSDAVRLANGVAASFIHYVTQLNAGYSGPALAALRHQSSQLTQQINNLQTQIDTVSNRLNSEGAGSSAGQQDATLLGQLQDEQNQVSLQLNAVTSSLATTQAGVDSAAGATLVLQKATVQPMSKYGLPIEAGILGFLIGLLGARYSCSSGLNPEVACGSGTKSPVLRAPRSSPRSKHRAAQLLPTWRALLEGAPRATDEWALRHLRYAVQNGALRSAVRVISFAGDSAALTTGPRLALQAAANGIRTCLHRKTGPSLTIGRSLRYGQRSQAARRSVPGSRSPSAEPVTAALRYNCWSQSSCSTELRRRWPLLMR